jgi:hypothetical protein
LRLRLSWRIAQCSMCLGSQVFPLK